MTAVLSRGTSREPDHTLEPRVSITKVFRFAAHHKLPNHGGKCRRDHGHNYRLEVTVTGPVKANGLSDDGMVMDFGDLKGLVNPLLEDCLDHYSLNALMVNPTAELLGLWLLERLPAEVSRITIWETDDSFATVERAPTSVPAPTLGNLWFAASEAERLEFMHAITAQMAVRAQVRVPLDATSVSTPHSRARAARVWTAVTLNSASAMAERVFRYGVAEPLARELVEERARCE